MQSTPEKMFSSGNTEWSTLIEQQMGPDFFKNLAKGQSPKLLWIGCADSRVPETIIMNAGPGDIFVHRNIANQFHLSDDSAQSVLEFGVGPLEIRTIYVVGHTDCGGAAEGLRLARERPSADAGKTLPALRRWLGPMTELARRVDSGPVPEDQVLNKLIEENVRAQVANVIKTDTIQNAWNEGKDVVIEGYVFEIENGKLRPLNIYATKDSRSLE
ncbi:hypothetical protein FRC04_011945 [Tulasnella sp. 424]|nr:hypothetical protein FRC04_011945 [Tulasnella sp. 424]KAG8970078.1 hypothetical protein FRC05_000726 [Tulasnella sp. 425]